MTRDNSRTLLFFAVFGVILFSAQAARAQQDPSIQQLQFQKSDSLIQAFVLIAGNDAIRYSLVCGAEDGLKSLEISSSDLIINRKECYGAKTCRMTGVFATSSLPMDVITVDVLSSAQAEQREKIKLNLKEGGDKVYMIAALPEFTGEAMNVVASNSSGANSPATGAAPLQATTTVIYMPPEPGPTITNQVARKAKNEFSLLAIAEDSHGMDFIELLEDGKFLDVEVCRGVKLCQMGKVLRITKPGARVYTIKAMNKDGKLSFQDVSLSFEE